MLTLAMLTGIFPAVTASAAEGGTFLFGKFRVYCDEPLTYRIFNITYDVKYDDDEEILYINTTKPVSVSPNEPLGNARIVIEEDATVYLSFGDFGSGYCLYPQNGKPAVTIESGVEATIYAYDSCIAAETGPAIYNDGTLNIASCSALEIHGGKDGAAIAGPGLLNIRDTNMKAVGGENGAGISTDGGRSPAAIYIENSIITAVGGKNGAGIGSGLNQNAGVIMIRNSDVTATGGENAAGIGSGSGGSCEAVNILGSVVTAAGGANADDIGAGAGGNGIKRIVIDESSSVKASRMGCTPQNIGGASLSQTPINNPEAGTVLIDDAPFKFRSHFDEAKVYPWLPEGTKTVVDSKKLYLGDFIVESTEACGTELDYDLRGGILTVNTSAPIEIRNRISNAATENWIKIAKGVPANVTLAGVNIVQKNRNPALLIEDSEANVKITLKEGTNNSLCGGFCWAGLHIGSDLPPAQTQQTLTICGKGSLYASGGERAAGIGGSGDLNGFCAKHIVIEDGNITAVGGRKCAGIGSGYTSHEELCCGDIEFRGGTINVRGGEDAHAIGGFVGYCGTRITVWPTVVLSAIPGDASDPSKPLPIAYMPIRDNADRTVSQLEIRNPNREAIVLDNVDIGSRDRVCYVFATQDIHCVTLGSAKTYYEYDKTYGHFREITPTEDTGDFTVTGGEYGSDYLFYDGVLFLRHQQNDLTIMNKNPKRTTAHRIVVQPLGSARVTLKDVDVSANGGPAVSIEKGGNVELTLDNAALTGGYASALLIENGNPSDVTLTLADDSVNLLTGATSYAALEKRGGAETGTLRIQGEGSLLATGGYSGAGIGCARNYTIANIEILSGCVTAVGNNAYDIGSGYGGKTQKLRIEKDASVKASSLGCKPYAIVEDKAVEVAPLKIEKPDGKDVYVDGELLPQKQHNNGAEVENNLYVYLTGGEHAVKLGENGGTATHAVSTNTGAFIVGGQNAVYEKGVLTINSDDKVIISNIDPDTPTTDWICVPAGVNANIVLAGVNLYEQIHTNGHAAIAIDGTKAGKVTITLAEGTQNTLRGTYYRAGIEINRGCTVEIKGNGSLNVGGGIGCSPTSVTNRSDSYNAGTIILSGGNITVTAGGRSKTAIGPALDNDTVEKIVISDNATVKATSFGIEPVNENGDKVYLYTIENPDAQNVFIDGKPFPHAVQSDGEEKLYVYLPEWCMVQGADGPTSISTIDTHKITVGNSTKYAKHSGSEWTTTEGFEIKANNRTYTGAPQAAVTVSGELPSGTVIKYALAQTDTFSTDIPQLTNAGDYTVWYSVSDVYGMQHTNVDVKVEKVPLTITANPNSITYGDAPAGAGVTYNGFISGESVENLDGELRLAFDYEQWDNTQRDSESGTSEPYTITPWGLTSDNYEITFVPGTLTVEKKALTVEDFSITNTGTVIYDGDPHTANVCLAKNCGGIGSFAVLYTKDGVNFVEAPVEVGTYNVFIVASGGMNYLPTPEEGFATGRKIRIMEFQGDPGDGGSSSPGTTVPVSGEENSVNVKATVSGKTATVQPIKEEEIEKVIVGDVDTSMVTVDLSGLKQDVTGVKLPTEMVEAIAEAAAETGNDTAGLKLKLSSGTLEFDAKALEVITEASGDAKNIEIHFDDVGITRLNADQKAAVSEMVVVEGFEAYVTVNGKRVSDFNGGSVTVYIPYEIPEGNNPAGYTVWFVAEDGTLEKQNATCDGTNHRFVVTHFSDYILAYDETYGAYDNCPKDETCPASKFTDVNVTAWYHDGVHFCVENGIIKGVSDIKFDTTGNITRAQIVTMLWRLDGEKYANYAMIFEDVPADTWYTEAVRWAAAEKIVSGYDAEHFGPTDPITREQLATILYNYAKSKGQGFTSGWMFLLDFVDRSDISSWADEAVHWCSMKGVVAGKDGKVFDPQGTATRAEAASMVQRFCEALEK